MPHRKNYLRIELPNDPGRAREQLQKIKDTMATAMMLKIDSTGITDAQDCFYVVCQTIYLTAHNQALESP